MTKSFIVDEFCDFLDPTKICDNCGECLNLSKSDLQAIKIEEIAKNIEENSLVEADLEEANEFETIKTPNWEELVEKAQKIDPSMNKEEIEKALLNMYSDLNEDFKEHLEKPEYNLNNSEKVTEHDDFFDHELIYLDDLNISEEDLDLDTEEIFPGMRKLK